MKRKFKSKIGISLVISLIIILIPILIVIIKEENSLPGILILLGLIGFIVHLFVTTYYTVEGEN